MSMTQCPLARPTDAQAGMFPRNAVDAHLPVAQEIDEPQHRAFRALGRGNRRDAPLHVADHAFLPNNYLRSNFNHGTTNLPVRVEQL
jgi:hypothetical protein